MEQEPTVATHRLVRGLPAVNCREAVDELRKQDEMSRHATDNEATLVIDRLTTSLEKPPSRNKLVSETGIGATRARRLLEQRTAQQQVVSPSGLRLVAGPDRWWEGQAPCAACPGPDLAGRDGPVRRHLAAVLRRAARGAGPIPVPAVRRDGADFAGVRARDVRGCPRLRATDAGGVRGVGGVRRLGVRAALELSGPLRTLLGPVLALVLLHAALGIEIRAGSVRTTVWSRIGREFRERFLSRLGLGDDDRDAMTRTQQRAALRFAHLTEARFVLLRTARLRRAARTANLAHDPVMKDRAKREHAVISNLKSLKEVEHESTW